MKQSINDLAIFGGRALFEEPRHVAQLNMPLKQDFDELTDTIWQSKLLTNQGPLVQTLENKLKQFLQVKHAVLINNATTGIMLSAMALDLKNGDEVIAPSFTFSATAQALWMLGINIIFCDIDSNTHNIDPKKIEMLITPNTKAILAVHLWGHPCDIKQLELIAQKNRLKLFFDSSHAMGCKYHSKYIGGFGDAEIFSLHATKILSSVEGGVITTNDDTLFNRLCSLLNFGYSKFGLHEEFGINAKMHEFSAAYGLLSLKDFTKHIVRNKAIHDEYQNGLSSICNFYDFNPLNNPNYQYNIIYVDKSFGLSRDELLSVLHTENILARKYFSTHCAMLTRPKHITWPETMKATSLPKTELISDKILQLPSGQSITQADAKEICQIIKFIFKNSIEIASLLKSFI